jgi:hypothetical protein
MTFGLQDFIVSMAPSWLITPSAGITSTLGSVFSGRTSSRSGRTKKSLKVR